MKSFCNQKCMSNDILFHLPSLLFNRSNVSLRVFWTQKWNIIFVSKIGASILSSKMAVIWPKLVASFSSLKKAVIWLKRFYSKTVFTVLFICLKIMHFLHCRALSSSSITMLLLKHVSFRWQLCVKLHAHCFFKPVALFKDRCVFKKILCSNQGCSYANESKYGLVRYQARCRDRSTRDHSKSRERSVVA